MESDSELEYGDQGHISSDDDSPVEHAQLASHTAMQRPQSRLRGISPASAQMRASNIEVPVYEPPSAGGYNPDNFEDLPVSEEVQEVFQYVLQYKPEVLQLETPLKPFIPDYVPAVGDIDEFIKVARPDGKPDLLGLKVLDEPAAIQSDPAVLTMQLRQSSKQAGASQAAGIVARVENPAKNSKRITDWIKSIGNLQKARPSSNVHISNAMPDIESLMQQWPAEVEQQLHSIKLPDATLDVDLGSFVQIVCNVMDIPVYGNPIEALHVLFTLLLEFKSNPAFKASQAGGLGLGLGLADPRAPSQQESRSNSQAGLRNES
ncbi:hypothetical protein ABBQ32_004831 [Trebouxia sp. C0010 RCD-2024]